MKRMKQAGMMVVVLLSGAVGSGMVQGGDWHWLGIGTDWRPRLTLDGQGGTNSYGIVDAMLPLLGSKNGLLFLDGRGLVQIRGVQNASIGLGYRGLVNHEKLLLGGYGFYDKPRTSWGNFYRQVNAGGEIFGGCWEGRVNGYLPVGVTSNEKILGGQGRFEDHQLILNFDVGREQLLPGVSVEVGRQLGSPKLKGYGEYYYYGFLNGVTGINGGRVRAEYEVNRYVTLTASDQYDSYNKNQVLVGMRINLGGVRGETKGLRDRMEDWIQRDSFMREEQAEAPLVIVHNQKYYFVKAGAEGGNGSYGHPYGMVSEAVEAAGAGDHVIYAYGGNYSLGNGASLYEGQQVYGANASYYVQGVEVLPKGAVDTILQGGLQLANNTSLTNLTVDGSGVTNTLVNHASVGSAIAPVVGLSGNNLAYVRLNNVTVQNFSGVAGAPGASGGGAGGDGGDVYGIQLLNGTHITLNNVTVQNIAGGQGGTGADNPSGAGGNGGNGGNATGIDLSSSSYVNILNSNVSQITGGSSQGGQNTGGSDGSSGNGGQAGDATAVDISSLSNVVITDTSISTVVGGNSIGAYKPGLSTYGESGAGGSGGNAVAINANSDVNVFMRNLTISTLSGGFSQAGSTSSNAASPTGNAGSATGILLTGSSNVKLTSLFLSSITGGYSQGGNTSSGGNYYGSASSDAGMGGNVIGVDLSKSSNVILNNSSFVSLLGGLSQGGSTFGSSGTPTGRGNTAGSAVAINVSSANSIQILNNQVYSLIGGNSQGGDTTYPGVKAGNGGTGGNAIGIDATGAMNATVSNNTFGNVVAGTAPGGTGNPNGVDGTPGTAVDQQGP